MGVIRLSFLLALSAFFILLAAFDKAIFMGKLVSALPVAYLIAALSIILAYVRGGVRSYVFWISLIAVAPIITPAIVDALGYIYFSGRALGHQTPALIQWPILYGALACLFLSLAISSGEEAQIQTFSQIKSLRSSGVPLGFLSGIVGMVFFAWLAEPGGVILSTESYADLKEQRFDAVPFAGGALVVFFVLAVGQYHRLMSKPMTQFMRKLIRATFVVAIVFVTFYLIAHARRSELAGMLVFLLIFFGHRISKKTMALSIVAAIVLMSVVGYVRALYEEPLDVQFEKDYVQLPGGPGNVLIGFVVAHEMTGRGVNNIDIGESYLGHLMRLPPKFLDIYRPPTAYEYLDNYENLQGGEYFLIEPLLNFGPLGIILFIWIFAFFANFSITSVNKYFTTSTSSITYLVTASFLVSMFRFLWYGFGPLIKTLIIAVLVALAGEIFRRILRYSSRSPRLKTTLAPSRLDT